RDQPARRRQVVPLHFRQSELQRITGIDRADPNRTLEQGERVIAHIHLPKQRPLLEEDLRLVGRRIEGAAVGKSRHLGVAQLAVVPADQEPGLPGTRREHHGAREGSTSYLPITQRVTAQAEPERDLRVVRVEARCNPGPASSWAGSTGVYLSRVASFMASSTLKSTGVKPLSVKIPRARSRITSAAPCLRASTVIMAAPQQARALTARPAGPAASA